MTINFTAPIQESQLKPRITVIGVGGAGGNAVNNMITNELEGVEFVVANTDAQAIAQAATKRSVQLGINITHGLGAGARPDMGRAAAEEAIDELTEQLAGSHMLFVAAGMGGGTGTGAAPVIARLAREQGMLTVGVVTKPFQFEGTNRMRIADAGIEEMQQFVDTLIVIPNQNLFRVANEKTTFADAFAMADDVLHSGVRGVTDLMVVPGLINLDFADIRSVMSEMGKAMMGTGESEGEDRAKMAAEAAISNPLLDDVSMKGARGVLINITGGPDMTLFEVDEAANRIGDEVDPEANIIFGSALDPKMEGRIRVSVVATGIDADINVQPRPILRVYSEPALTLVDDEPETDTGSGNEAEAEQPATMTEPEQLPDTVAVAEPEAEPMAATGTEGMATAEPFIPPPPVVPGHSAPSATAAEPDPFRAADLINGGQAAPAPKRGNLFRRMTGVGLNRKDANGGARARQPIETRPAEPSLSAQPMAAAAPAPEPVPQAEPEQSRLDMVEKSAPVGTAQSEEDLLDIPAFLRRQAN